MESSARSRAVNLSPCTCAPSRPKPSLSLRAPCEAPPALLESRCIISCTAWMCALPAPVPTHLRAHSYLFDPTCISRGSLALHVLPSTLQPCTRFCHNQETRVKAVCVKSISVCRRCAAAVRALEGLRLPLAQLRRQRCRQPRRPRLEEEPITRFAGRGAGTARRWRSG